MSRLRLHRFATIVMVMVALLFAQLALAQYACPVAATEGEQTVAMDMAPGQPCAGMEHDSDTPTLCHHHCADAAQSFEPVKVPAASLPAVVQVLIVPLRVDPARRQAVAFAAAGEAQPPPRSVFLSTLRLRV